MIRLRRRPRLLGALAALALAVAPALPGGSGAQAATAPAKGYWFVAADGGIFSFGDAPFAGSTGSMKLNQPIVGMSPTPTGRGYWFVASDGGIFSFGDAKFFGSMGGKKLNRPIVGMAPTPTGAGYWFVAADGGVFSFGDAKFFGSTGSIKLAKPIVAMAATPSGKGYWFVASDGGVFNYGDAGFHGAGTGSNLHAPVVSIAATPSGKGYYLAAADGTVVAFGDASFRGSMGGKSLKSPIVGLAPTSTGGGYWLVAADGGIFSFGDAAFYGSTGNVKLNRAIVGMAAAPLKSVGGNTSPTTPGGGTVPTSPGTGGTVPTGPGDTTTTTLPPPAGDIDWGTAGATSVLAKGSTGGGTAFRPWMSGDGRYLVFDSDGTKVCGTGSALCVAPTDTAKIRDVYLYDRTTGAIERISVGANNARAAVPGSCSAICGSQRATISQDGRYVAFWSNATNLVAGDTNNKYDAFLFDRNSRTMTLVSKGFNGAQADGDSARPVVSRDGSVVAFESAASNLIAPATCGLLTPCKGGDKNGADDVFLYDVATGNVSLVSATADGSSTAGASDRPSLSGNGRKVAFQSGQQVLVRDLASGQTTVVGPGRSPSLSYDGRFVSFDSSAGNVAGDTGGDTDVYLKDLQTGSVEQISIPNGGGQATCNSCSAVGSDSSISADGRFVAFWSDATGLVPGDNNGAADVFVRDRQNNTLTRVTSSNGVEGNGDSFSPALSLDGRFVALDSKASSLDTSGGSVNGQDIFVHVNF